MGGVRVPAIFKVTRGDEVIGGGYGRGEGASYL